MSKILVTYDMPRMLSLPYENTTDGAIYQDFLPGPNKIEKDIWNKLVGYHGQEYLDSQDLEVEKVTINKDDKVNFQDIESFRDAVALVESTIDLSDLDYYYKIEKKTKKRPKMYGAMKAHREKLDQALLDLKKAEKDKLGGLGATPTTDGASADRVEINF